MFKLGDIAVSRKLMLLLSLALVGFIALLLISASALHRNLMSEREARLQAVLDLAMSRIQALAATLPPEQAKAQAKAMLDSMRFDGDNYLFVLDENRRMVVHPVRPELVGQQMGESGTATAGVHWQQMVDLGKGGHSGRLEYKWISPSGEAAQKMSLVAGYQPWGWILGSGVLLQDIQATIWSQYQLMGGATLLVTLLMGLLGFAISRSIVNPLTEINKAMARVAVGDLGSASRCWAGMSSAPSPAPPTRGWMPSAAPCWRRARGPATWRMPPCASPPPPNRPTRRSTVSGISSPSSPPP